MLSVKTKHFLQLWILKDIRAKNQLGKKREMVSAILRQIDVQRLLIEKPNQFCTIKGGRVLHIELTVKKQVTAIQVQPPLKKPQCIFGRDRVPVNTALHGTVDAEECADRFQFHAVFLLLCVAFVGYGMEHHPTPVHIHHHPNMSVATAPIQCCDGAAFTALPLTENKVSGLQLHRVGHDKFNHLTTTMATC